MPPSKRIAASVAFAVSATLALMFIVSRFPGMGIPVSYWIFGGLCPGLVSLPVSYRLVRQSERNRLLHAELSDAYERLKQQSETDQLTGMMNRATFYEQAEALHAREPGWALILDVDHFKAINDQYGHEVGDRALRAIATILRGAVRARDLLGRIGGEEFAIYLPGASRQIAINSAERIREMVAGTTVADIDGGAIFVTVSIGLACSDEGTMIKDALRNADFAMYRAKDGGRNQIHLAA